MATPSIASRAPPTCLHCLRRPALLFAPLAAAAASPLAAWTQTRGAKASGAQAKAAPPKKASAQEGSKPRGTTRAEKEDLKGIPVRMLRDFPGFGRRGAIIRVKAGRMRNIFHHRGIAEYMTRDRFREAGLTMAAVGVRDRSFGSKLKVERKKKEPKKKVLVGEGPIAKKEALTLTPEESHQLLVDLLPPVLVFLRRPQPAAPVTETTTTLPQAKAKAKADKKPAPKPSPEHRLIFGSVTKDDVLGQVREALMADANGNRVALEAEAVVLHGLDAEAEDAGSAGARIKRLGRYEVDIVVPGHEPVRRVVSVEPGDEWAAKVGDAAAPKAAAAAVASTAAANPAGNPAVTSDAAPAVPSAGTPAGTPAAPPASAPAPPASGSQ